MQTAEITGQDGTVHRFRYLNGAPLNESHFDLQVNFLDYEEQRPSGKVQQFTWVTDSPLHSDTLVRLLRGAQPRGKIKNETVNTLKHPGDYVEHTLQHGYQHLSTVLAYLMRLACLIDPMQQHCCGLFQQGVAKQGCKRDVRETLRRVFFTWLLPDWETLYRSAGLWRRPDRGGAV